MKTKTTLTWATQAQRTFDSIVPQDQQDWQPAKHLVDFAENEAKRDNFSLVGERDVLHAVWSLLQAHC